MNLKKAFKVRYFRRGEDPGSTLFIIQKLDQFTAVTT